MVCQNKITLRGRGKNDVSLDIISGMSTGLSDPECSEKGVVEECFSCADERKGEKPAISDTGIHPCTRGRKRREHS